MMMMVMKHKLGRKSRWREICRLGKQLREKKESRRGVVEDRGFNWPLQQWNNGDKLVFFSLFNQQLTTTWRRWPGLRCADDICSPRDMVTFWVIDYYKRNTHTHTETHALHHQWEMRDWSVFTCRAVWQNEDQAAGKVSKTDFYIPLPSPHQH